MRPQQTEVIKADNKEILFSLLSSENWALIGYVLSSGQPQRSGYRNRQNLRKMKEWKQHTSRLLGGAR